MVHPSREYVRTWKYLPAGSRVDPLLYPKGGPTGSWNQLRRPNLAPHGRVSGRLSESKDVLVVDDEPYLCDLLSNVLESEGHSARTASNGLEALEAVKHRIPNLILLDLMMPVMDGWEFIERLRANRDWAEIPVVLITAIYDVKRTQQQTGARAVITKPFDIDQVSEVVRIFAS